MMNRAQWAKPVSPDEASRRAAGRDKYNKWQKDEALRSRLAVARMLCELGDGRGVQSQIAEKQFVHRSTVSRYIAELRRSGWDAMDLEQRQKWIERSWAQRNEERAREHSRWVKNGGPEAAKLRQQLHMEGLIQRRQPPVEPVQAPERPSKLGRMPRPAINLQRSHRFRGRAAARRLVTAS